MPNMIALCQGAKFEESGLNNWSTSKFHNEGRNQVSGRVSVSCWHATPVSNASWEPLIIGEGQARYQCHEIGGKSDWLGSHCRSRIRISFNIRERDTSYCIIRSPYRPYNFLNMIALFLTIKKSRVVLKFFSNVG